MKNLKYILMVLLGGAMYGTMSSFVKLSYAEGFDTAQIAFAQAMLAALFLGACALPDLLCGRIAVSAKEASKLAFAGASIGLTNYLYYRSVSLISASLAIVALMQFTWICLLIEWICFCRKPSRLEAISAVLILSAAVFASGIPSCRSLSFSVEGLALALLSSATYAAYIAANGRTAKSLRWHMKGCIIMAVSASTIFLANCKTIIFCGNFSGNFLLWAVFLAAFGTTIPTAMFAAAIPRIGAAISSILMTIELPVAVICAHFVLGEQIGCAQAAGVAAMLVSISLMNYFKAKQSDKDGMSANRRAENLPTEP